MENGELNIQAMTESFADVLGDPEGSGFYTRYFAIPNVYKSASEGNPLVGVLCLVIAAIFGVLAWRFHGVLFIPAGIFAVVGIFLLIGGLAALTNISDFDKYMDKSIDRSVEVFQTGGWDNRYLYDPTGFTKLAQADSEIMWIWGVIAVLIVAAAAVWVWKG